MSCNPNAVIQTARPQIGYLEKKSNAGSGNHTKTESGVD